MRFMLAALLPLGLSQCCGVPSPPVCSDRTGGACITFQVVDDQITLWITNEAFIAQAETLLETGGSMVPNFGQVIAGSDVDAAWSWHVDPVQMEWADVTIEVCDATPSYIEANLDAWINEVGNWCPWSAQVLAVERS